jgi:hypothetical protein
VSVISFDRYYNERILNLSLNEFGYYLQLLEFMWLVVVILSDLAFVIEVHCCTFNRGENGWDIFG